MLQLTTAYVQQADREREIATDLQNRQLLQPTPRDIAPIEVPVTANHNPRRAPARARAVGR